MSYVIATRNPTTGKLVLIQEDHLDNVAEFKTVDDATEAARRVAICRAWAYVILEIEDKL